MPSTDFVNLETIIDATWLNEVDEATFKGAKFLSTMSDLLTADTGFPTVILGFHSAGDGGGGTFFWDSAEDKANHNGGTIIDPDNTADLSVWDATEQTTWFTAGTGAGCWKRVSFDHFNFKYFGATGDGSTDDTKSVQATVDGANGVRSTGPAGTYMIDAESGGISMPSNTHLHLDQNAELKAIINNATQYQVIRIGINANAAGEARNRSNITIKGGRITGDKDDHTGVTGEAGHCIYIRNAEKVLIEGVTITEGWGDGIYLGTSQGTYRDQDTSPKDIMILNNTITDNSRNNISVVAGENVLVKGNNLANADRTDPQSGIDIEPTEVDLSGGDGVIAKNIRVIGNAVYNNDGNGIDLAFFGSGNLEGCIISGNSVYGNGTAGIKSSATGTVNVHGVLIDGNTVSANTGNQIQVNGPFNVKVTNNHIFKGVDDGTDGDGIRLGPNAAYGCQIAYNVINEMPRYGIQVNTTSTSDHIAVVGNIVNGSSQLTNATYSNILVGGSVHYCLVQGNVVTRDSSANLTNEPDYGIETLNNEQIYVLDNVVELGGATANTSIASMKTVTVTGKHIVKGNQGYANESVEFSDTFIVGTTGVKTVTVAHNLDYTPSPGQVHVTLVADTVTPSSMALIHWVDSCDATNVTVKINVTAASGISSDTMKLAVRIPASV